MAMNKKAKVNALLIIFTTLFMLSLSFSKFYSNPYANLVYTLNKDGSITVHEEIVYDISCPTSDCYHELYTWHPSDISISSASGKCLETTCSFFTSFNGQRYEMILRKEGGFTTGRYSAVFDYTIKSEILEQKDVAQFFYKVWYDQWEKDVDDLKITINIPGYVNDTIYFIHPNKSTISTNAYDNKIIISSYKHPANQYLEINLLMPKEWFSNLRKADNYMTKDDIIRGETLSNLSDALIFFMNVIVLILPFLSFIIIYFLYGRDEDFPELKMLPEYIRDISEIDEKLSPSEAALLLKGFGNIIENNELSNIITAEIMELYRLGYLDIYTKKNKNFFGMEYEDVYLIPNKDKDASKLTKIQQAILNFIIANSEDGKFNTKKFMTTVISTWPISLDLTQPYKYPVFVFEGVRGELLRLNNNYMDKTGLKIMRVMFFVTVFFLPFIFILLMSLLNLGSLAPILHSIIISFIAWLIIYLLAESKPTIMSKWTKDGRIKHEKMKRYKAFLEDFTLLKEKMPKDVLLWEKALVYATAFGISEKVIKTLNVVMPEYTKQTRYVAFRHAKNLSTSIKEGISYMQRTKPGGGFGAGRGRGGGGGGAR